MPTPTTTYSFSKPTVGADDNAWGTELNNNLDKLDDLLDGTLSIAPNLGTGWEVNGTAVTASAAQLNILSGATITTTELNRLGGVTSAIQTQLDARQPLDATLTALAAFAATGLVARTGVDVFEARTIRGTANQISVANGNGQPGDPTISAVVASQAEAEAGTDTTKLMTAQRVEQHMTANALGWGQTWQDVSGSRTLGTSYQNTTGRPIVVAVGVFGPSSGGGQPFFQVSADNSTWINVAWHSDAAVQTAAIVVPNGWYYRTQNMTNFSAGGGWSELR